MAVHLREICLPEFTLEVQVSNDVIARIPEMTLMKCLLYKFIITPAGAKPHDYRSLKSTVCIIVFG